VDYFLKIRVFLNQNLLYKLVINQIDNFHISKL